MMDGDGFGHYLVTKNLWLGASQFSNVDPKAAAFTFCLIEIFPSVSRINPLN
jgi:hypothetical protein